MDGGGLVSFCVELFGFRSDSRDFFVGKRVVRMGGDG